MGIRIQLGKPSEPVRPLTEEVNRMHKTGVKLGLIRPLSARDQQFSQAANIVSNFMLNISLNGKNFDYSTIRSEILSPISDIDIESPAEIIEAIKQLVREYLGKRGVDNDLLDLEASLSAIFEA